MERTGRNVGRTVAHAVAGLTLAAFAVVSLAQAAQGTPERGFTSGSLNVAVGRADAELGPVFSVGAAYPGMKPATGRIVVRNTGTIDELHTVSASVTREDGPSLADVLVVTVRDDESGARVYRGSLADLRFSSTRALPAGDTDRYDVSVTWPTSADDDALQGASLTFDLRVDSAPAQ